MWGCVWVLGATYNICGVTPCDCTMGITCVPGTTSWGSRVCPPVGGSPKMGEEFKTVRGLPLPKFDIGMYWGNGVGMT